MPMATKLENNKEMRAIRRAMMVLVPVTLVGSIPTVFVQLPNLPGLPSGLASVLSTISNVLSPLSLATYGLLGLFVAIFTSMNYAKEKDIWEIGGIITTVICFISIAAIPDENSLYNLDYFSGKGIFLALILSMVCIQLLSLFSHKLKLSINLGDGVPAPIAKSFENLWPILFTCLIIITAKGILEASTGVKVVKMVELIFNPLTNLVSTLPGLLVIFAIQQILWWFGIHGYSIMSAIWMPVAFANADVNANLLKTGAAMSEFKTFTPDFVWNVVGLSGSGITIGLIILMLFSKSKKNKTLAKTSLVPAFFGVNEPVIFGLPIMTNPIMFIPFVFTPLITAVIAWFAFDFGLVNKFALVSPYTPIPIGGVVATLDFRYVILVLVIVALSIAMYYPFFKIQEKKDLAAAENVKEESLDDLDI